jgi:hypothetical protein
VEMTPPAKEGGRWKVTYNWQDEDVGQSTQEIPEDQISQLDNDDIQLTFDFQTGDKTPPRSPGIAGKLRFVVSKWNTG